MKKPELLSPAGSLETALAAFDGGADAVYCGLSKFNARERAVNFSFPELRTLLERAHTTGKKVYVTFNTLIRNDELDECRIHLIDGGQRNEIPPGMVIIGPAVECVPTVERRILTLEGTLSLKGIFPVEIEAVGAGMGVHAVQNHLDAPLVGSVAHGGEVCLRAQHGVRGLVIAGVIAVAGKAFADGIQVKNIDA